MPFLVILTAAVFLLPFGLHAEEGDSLNLDETALESPIPVEGEAEKGFPTDGQEENSSASHVKAMSKPVESRRFGVEDQERFRLWLLNLCREEARAEKENVQRIKRQEGYFLRRPKNKQGALLLLLENYLGALNLKEHCESKKPKKDCSAKADQQPAWRGPASSSFYASSAEAGIQQIRETLRMNFYEVRELSELNGTPDSRSKAQATIRKIKELSTCQTRAFKESSFPHEKRTKPASSGSR